MRIHLGSDPSVTLVGDARERVTHALTSNAYAVLATEGSGQPHASFMAYATLDDARRLVFATYRDTRKYANMTQNPRVALLVDCREREGGRLAVTAIGHAREVTPMEKPAAVNAFRAAHPDFGSFLDSPDSALFLVTVDWYESAAGIDRVEWWRIGD